MKPKRRKRKAREWWVILHDYRGWGDILPALLIYSNKEAALDCAYNQKVFKVREILPKRKRKPYVK